MKKHISTVIMICCVVFSFVFGACSSDDNDSKDSTQLVLQASATKALVGETITFTVLADKLPIEGVTITEKTLGQIKDLTWTPTKSGTYQFTAKKEGYQDSKTLTIVVEEGIGKLNIETNRTFGKPNDVFEFKITSNGQPVQDVEIEVVGLERFTGNTWTAKEFGTFKFIAHKKGFASSDVLTIEIKNYSYFTYKDEIYLLDKSYFNFYRTVTEDFGIFDVWGLVMMSDDFENKIVFLAGFERKDPKELTFPEEGEVLFGGFAAAQFYANGMQLREISTLDSTMFITKVEPFKPLREDFYVSDRVAINFDFVLENNTSIKGELDGPSELDFETVQTGTTSKNILSSLSDKEVLQLIKRKK
ncbi:hypothetical protein NWE55_14250 [Myroides albus]|uniref:hypothetical protein n=1 Tax=Myroides albus TaxID=2562892 RepID=UPI0021594969|nr:hypothetical protein [Myroides albus]UVD79276.1 hypothetical protein NWE55_14250 [Myroides albus]